MFRPVVYNDSDLVAYKFSSNAANSVKSGWACVDGLHMDGDIPVATPINQAGIVCPASAELYLLAQVKRAFLVYKEDPDPEVTLSGQGTIAAGDKIMAFFGKEFEISRGHMSMPVATFNALTYGTMLYLTNVGRLCAKTKVATQASYFYTNQVPFAMCLGTKNGIMRGRLLW